MVRERVGARCARRPGGACWTARLGAGGRQEVDVMAGDEGAKDEIAKGMSEAGKDAAPKGGQGAGGSDEIATGMSEAGSGAPTDAEGSGGGPTEERPDRPRDEAAVDD